MTQHTHTHAHISDLDEMIFDICIISYVLCVSSSCGKTEIARRLARLTDSPFIKVEATKFTEVGFHGKDVDSIIQDLVRIAIQNMKAKRRRDKMHEIKKIVEEKILKTILIDETAASSFLEPLRNGELDDVDIEIEVPIKENDSGDSKVAEIANMLKA